VLLLSHLLLELLELPRRRGLARGTIHVRLEQLVLEIHARTCTPRALDVAPRLLGAVVALHSRPVPLGALQLRLHLFQLALGERELFTLRRQFSLQNGDALAVLGREPLGHRDGLLILNLPRQPAAPLRIRQALAFYGQLSIGAGDGLLDLGDGDLRVNDGLTHLAREHAQIGWTCGGIQGSAERVPQALEQSLSLFLDQLLRMVFAKKGESTGWTERDEHFGQAGR
jgi:hypothetical protein